MKVSDIETVLSYTFQANIPVNIIGQHGVGKTTATAQAARDLGYPNVYVFPVGQYEDPAEVTGFPSVSEDESGAKFLESIFPKFFPKPGEKAVVIFDDITRAPKHILQALMPILMEKRIRDVNFGDNVKIVTTSNPDGLDYIVTSFNDPAYTSRMCYLILSPDTDEWVDFMRNKYSQKSSVAAFIKSNPSWVRSELNVKLPTLTPSDRSWEMVQKLEDTGIPESLFIECVTGMVGEIAAGHFVRFRQKMKEVSVHGRDILTNYEGSGARNNILQYQEFNPDVVSYALDTLKTAMQEIEPTKEYVDNLIIFLKDIRADFVITLFNGFWEICKTQTEANGDFNENLKKYFFDHLLERQKNKDPLYVDMIEDRKKFMPNFVDEEDPYEYEELTEQIMKDRGWIEELPDNRFVVHREKIADYLVADGCLTREEADAELKAINDKLAAEEKENSIAKADQGQELSVGVGGE